MKGKANYPNKNKGETILEAKRPFFLDVEFYLAFHAEGNNPRALIATFEQSLFII